MTDSCSASGALSAADVDELARAYAEDRYDDCLRRACVLLLRANHGGRSLEALLTFIHRSAEHLLETNRDAPAQRAVACSFCAKSPPDVRLGAGPSAFICNGCVASFSAILG
jgi:ClpX C4-type zinc finger